MRTYNITVFLIFVSYFICVDVWTFFSCKRNKLKVKFKDIRYTLFLQMTGMLLAAWLFQII